VAVSSSMNVFPAVGGRLSLDFVATVGKRGTLNVERLRGAADVSRWAEHAGLGAVNGADDAALEAARDLREAVYRLCETALGRRPAHEVDVAVVNRWARHAAAPLAAAVVEGRLVRADPPLTVGGLLAAVARDAVDLLADADGDRVRECEGSTCTLLFLDASRGGRRRWCSMNSCGARSKMSTLRAKQGSEPGSAR